MEALFMMFMYVFCFVGVIAGILAIMLNAIKEHFFDGKTRRRLR